ncbi:MULTISPECIES: L-rhamnose mutarotase [Pseudomonas]|jgi:L-rhamnose mutarotase|uniref:L-rhamnose mutarotase n=2 Tax=Pseudomonas TaxID=286 RepID=A0A5E6MKR4_PSEFL|nr:MULTISPECIES: L-rhamnose mutarotase [Pseudomonas]VVM13254.1 L-rhamnose mutarotase [Pseudomonas fluorescens]MBC3234326.1 L-rhamnose mutarotase [Pseudomonas lurida]MBC3242762.1 L-rhamnose mutarotase [Pseudomonas lurida]MBC3245194.1 L-rhamnose mutarotase [Pseudomonas lurida]MBC8979005.1 L-rhamnose mutarotase [Pseudomonas lurida]
MQTRAFRMNLNPGQAIEYQRRHDDLWPELAQALLEAGVVDYRIFLDEPTNALFAVLTHEDVHGLDELPGTALMQRWWTYMQDIMPSHADASPVSVDLLPMFQLTRP